MESYFEQLKRAITPFTAPATKSTAPAMDSITECMADAAAASYIASIAEDADFKEEAHPREEKGGKGGGRFRTSGKTIEREDSIENIEESDDEYYKNLIEELKKKVEEYKASKKATAKRKEGESVDQYLHRAMETTGISERIRHIIEHLEIHGYKISGNWRKGEPISIEEPEEEYEDWEEDVYENE